MKNFKGIIYAALSSSTFGLAPLFSILLLSDGFSSFEVLSYRWGVASLTLGIIGLAGGCRFRISRQELCTVFFLSLFRAATSLSLVIAYQNISSGVASIIHFMYPLAVALAMALFFRERISWRTAAAIGVSLAGVALLSTGGIGSRGGDTTAGTIAAAVSVFAYAGYIIGVRKSRAAQVESTTLTFYVMAFGALLFLCGGMFTGGVRLVTDGKERLAILGLALPATAISNITLVRAIKFIGPTLTSIFGALEPLTAVAIGATVFGERFGWTSALGVGLVGRQHRRTRHATQNVEDYSFFLNVANERMCQLVPTASRNSPSCAHHHASTTRKMQYPIVSQINDTETIFACKGIARFSRKLRI